MNPTPTGEHDATFHDPAPAKWRDNPNDWAASITTLRSLAGHAPGDDSLPGGLAEPTTEAAAIARMVFYTASEFNTLYSHPHPFLIRMWGHLFDGFDWLDISLAEDAVRAHFASPDCDGEMNPGHVIREAKKITGRIS